MELSWQAYCTVLLGVLKILKCVFPGRFLSRSALQKQVSLLESSKNLQLADLTLPPEVSVENLDVVGGSGGSGGVGGIRSKVRAWSSVDYEAYASLPITE